jgi:hypothetical protein
MLFDLRTVNNDNSYMSKDEKARKPKRIGLRVFWSVLVIAAVAWFVIGGLPLFTGIDVFPSALENPDIEIGPLGVTVYNNSYSLWMNIRLEINSGTYTCDVAYVRPGSSHYEGFLSFADKQGQVFNPLTHKVTEFGIRTYSGTWPNKWGSQKYASWTITRMSGS